MSQFKFKCSQAQPHAYFNWTTMASHAVPTQKRGNTGSTSSKSGSVLSDATNKAEKLKIKLAVGMHLDQMDKAPASK
jgi:hypothetical protein